MPQKNGFHLFFDYPTDYPNGNKYGETERIYPQKYGETELKKYKKNPLKPA